MTGWSAARRAGSEERGAPACQSGTQICQDDGTYSTCFAQILPTTESCDGLDNDCDGEGFYWECATLDREWWYGATLE